MAANPKIEFFRIKLKAKSKKNEKTFRDFAIEELEGDKEIGNDDAFKLCFNHFISKIQTGHSKNAKHKKTITIISNPETNPYYSLKPSLRIKENIISGVLNGGPYDKDAIVSSIADKSDNSKLGRDKSVLLPYYVFVYLPSDHYEGLIAIHSNSIEETVTHILKKYISNLFSGSNFFQAKLYPYVPQSFQDEFKDGALIKNMTFSSTIIDNTTPSNKPINNIINEYDINIQITPKKTQVSILDSTKLLNFINKMGFTKNDNKDVALKDFKTKKFIAKNQVTKKEKVFEWNSKDHSFQPTIYLEGRVNLNDGTPDFKELDQFCTNIFEEEIMSELRPDLNVSKFN
ncbi:hypothetical protein [Tamlana crocina]|uniref:Uncharacterized protein n=1 Tax=Tamlana crocina TaxID=393006 RepID=A0ABX1DI09_9FLAO|nr:hypothetical protein [Tamlana crocina]NJX16709.1 hypothetical protein [Tamlana crocina]